MHLFSKIINKELCEPTLEDSGNMNAYHEKNLTIKFNKVFTGRSTTEKWTPSHISNLELGIRSATQKHFYTLYSAKTLLLFNSFIIFSLMNSVGVMSRYARDKAYYEFIETFLKQSLLITLQWTCKNNEFAATVFKGEQLTCKSPEWRTGGRWGKVSRGGAGRFALALRECNMSGADTLVRPLTWNKEAASQSGQRMDSGIRETSLNSGSPLLAVICS